MEIGVIGLNDLTKTFCKHWIKRGHKILYADLSLYSDGYELAEQLGPNVMLTLPEKAARMAEVIVIAAAAHNLTDALTALGDVKQKIIIDLVVENPITNGHPQFKSSFEKIQKRFPEAKVVKITNEYPHNLFMEEIAAAQILYSYSMDHLAQRMVRWFIDGTGYKMIDLHDGTVQVNLNQKP